MELNFRKINTTWDFSPLRISLLLFFVLFGFQTLSAQIFVKEGTVLTVSSANIISADTIVFENSNSKKVTSQLGKLYITNGAQIVDLNKKINAVVVYVAQSKSQKPVEAIVLKETKQQQVIQVSKKSRDIVVQKKRIFYTPVENETFTLNSNRRTVAVYAGSGFSFQKLNTSYQAFNKNKSILLFSLRKEPIKYYVEDSSSAYYLDSFTTRGPPAA